LANIGDVGKKDDNTCSLRRKILPSKKGKTIVGVMDTTKAMYFHIGNDVMDGKNYE
jgi:hypothetical protein